MASSTAPSRGGSSCSGGTSKGIPVARILRFARTSRCPIVAGGTRKAWAMRAASSPSTVCSMRGVCSAGSIAGCAQTNSSSARRSGNASPLAAAAADSEARKRADSWCRSRTRRRRAWSIRRCRAAVSSHASGCFGSPSIGQEARAETRASPSASSAPATSRVWALRYASRRPYDDRATASTVPRASPIRSGCHDRLVGRHVHRAHLHRAPGGRGATGGPFERRVEGRKLEEDEAAQLLLRFGEGAVLHAGPPVVQAHGRGRPLVLEGGTPGVDASGDQGLVVGPPRGDVRVARAASPAPDVLGALVDQDDVLHDYPPPGR